ncbi:MAG: hypothetical protein QOF02_1702 [Blastocatellia bacterium]|nr:hypothetical protein [Blastocatellia bacterium]
MNRGESGGALLSDKEARAFALTKLLLRGAARAVPASVNAKASGLIQRPT